MGTIIYTDKSAILNEISRIESNVSILNQNYEKIKTLGFDAELCFYASTYANNKEKFREKIFKIYKKDFLPISQINERIREIEKKLFYNEFDELGAYLENEDYTEALKKNLIPLNKGVIFSQYDKEKDIFILVPDYKELIENEYTYKCENEKQEQVFKIMVEISKNIKNVISIVPQCRENFNNILLTYIEKGNLKNEVYTFINSIK